jgi:hypothetical protein
MYEECISKEYKRIFVKKLHVNERAKWQNISGNKTLPSGLKQIMSLVIQALNVIKFSALTSRIFTKLHFEMNAEST